MAGRSSNSRTSGYRDPRPHQQRCWMVQQGLTAMCHENEVVIDGKPRGRIVAMPNDHKPQLDTMDGGSNMRYVFEDGSSIPVEYVSAFEVR